MKQKNEFPILISGAGKLGQSLMSGIIAEEYPIMDVVVNHSIQPIVVDGQKFFTVSSWDYQRFLDMLRIYKNYPLIVDSIPGTVSQNNVKLYAQYPMMPKIIMSSGVKDKSAVKNTLFLENGCLEILAFELFLKQTEIDLTGYGLKILESHQSSKVDVSGTATKFLPHFQKWNLKSDERNIISIRDPQKQMEMFIPQEFLSGHAYHRYTITSPKPDGDKLKDLFNMAKVYFTNNPLFIGLQYNKSSSSISWENELILRSYPSFMFKLSCVEHKDGTQELQFEHAILGRQPYVNGLVQHAIPFMEEKIVNGLNGDNFSTIDLYKYALETLSQGY